MNEYILYKGAWIYNGEVHYEQHLPKEKVSELIHKGGMMVRNSFDFDCGEVTPFWYIIKDTFGGMEELSSNTRNQIRKCFQTIRVERINANFLSKNGYEVYVQACQSYNDKSVVPPSYESFSQGLLDCDGYEFWGCFDVESDKLVAFSMNYVTAECCEYKTMKAIPMYQKRYAYYGLLYEMNRYYLQERGLKYVSDGARSITEHSNIQPFLENKFKFRKAYCHLQIHYVWWLAIAVHLLMPFQRFINIPKIKAVLNMNSMCCK